jgi:hypothetical protein
LELYSAFLAALEKKATIGSELRPLPQGKELVESIDRAMTLNQNYRFGGQLGLARGYSFDVEYRPVSPTHVSLTALFEERLFDDLEVNKRIRISVAEWFVDLATAIDAVGFALLYVRDDWYVLDPGLFLDVALNSDIPLLIAGILETTLRFGNQQCIGINIGNYCVHGYLAPGAR